MRMLKQLKLNNNMKKSHVLLIGSLICFIGLLFLLSNYFFKIRDDIYSDMRIKMMDDDVVPVVNDNKEVVEAPVASEVHLENTTTNYVVDYSKYLGVLEIPKIRLKRGFYNTDSRYNNIQYNVAMLPGSTLPDVTGGNLILIAHSGDAYISYFAKLYQLVIGDEIFVTYNGVRYQYIVSNIYNVEKNGAVSIIRNYDKTSLTLITCTKDSDTLQTVYISELVG